MGWDSEEFCLPNFHEISAAAVFNPLLMLEIITTQPGMGQGPGKELAMGQMPNF